MPNKQITDLDPLVGGMDDTYNFWTQVDGGGAGSSFQMAWSKLFIAKDAVALSAGNGTDLVLRGGNGDGAGRGGYVQLFGGESPTGYGGNVELYSGPGGYYGGETNIVAGDGDTYGGRMKLQAGQGATGGDIRLYGGTGSAGEGGPVKFYGGQASVGYVGGSLFFGAGAGSGSRGFIYVVNLQTTDPGGTNRLWRDAGVLKIT